MSAEKEAPTVSVIIPTYNRAPLIGRAVRSVLNQTYQDFEVIVVDDGSQDNTEEVVKNFHDERIRYIKHEKNKGAAAARNSGIRVAKGKYIAFQDSDDEWLPRKLEKQMKVFETSPEVGVVFTDVFRVSKNGKMEYRQSPSIMEGKIINPKTSDYQVAGLPIASTVVRKKCFDKVGIFDERLPRLIDLDLFIRLSKNFRFHHIKEPLVKYYVTEGITSDSNALFIARELLLKKYAEDVKENKKFFAKQYFEMGYCLQLSGKFNEGKKYFLKAAKLSPLRIQFLWATFLSFLSISYPSYEKRVRIFRRVKNKIIKLRKS
jgi:glycosyltransferase involved in cell wall biosynthesis